MDFLVGIGTSNADEPIKATEEALGVAISNIKGNIDQVLLFATIHYEKNNGYQKIINTIYKTISKETNLIGGTVAGFMTRKGQFTKGIGILLISSPETSFKSNIGKNTKTTL